MRGMTKLFLTVYLYWVDLTVYRAGGAVQFRVLSGTLFILFNESQ